MKTSVVQMAEEVPLIPDDGDDGDIELGGWDAFGSLFGNPDQFLQQVLTTAGPVAIRVAIKKLRPKIEPVIKAKGLTWEDVLPALDLVDSVEELEAAIADPDAFLDKLAAIAGPVAIRLLIAKMRPKIEPVIKVKGLTWEDVLPALDLVDSVEELEAAIADPDAFLDKLAAIAGPVAIRLLIAKMRPKIEPVIKAKGLTWEDVLPALDLVDSVEELEAAIADPDAFLDKLAAVGGGVAMRLLIAKMRPKIEPVVKAKGLTWEDVLPALDLINTAEKLIEGAKDPEAFFQKLLSATSPVAIRVAIKKLRPKIEPVIKAKGLTWDDLLPALDLVDSVEELEAAIADPDAFLDKLAAIAGPVAIRLLIAKMRPKIEPVVKAKGLTWEDVLPALHLVDSVEELEAAITDPDAFLDKLAAIAGPVAIRLLIAKMRPKIEPVVKAKGLTWEDVLPALDLVDSVEELEAAIADPDAFLDKLAAIAGPVAIRLLIAKMRPKIEPVVKAKGLTWEDVLPALHLINTAEKLIEGAKDPEAFFQKLLSATSPAAIRLAICKLRSRVEPVVVKQGLTWADVLPALAMIDTMAEVKEAAENPAAFIKKEAFLKKIATVAGPGAVARNAKREKKARSSKISRDERAFAMIGTGAGFASMMAGRFGSESVAAVAGSIGHGAGELKDTVGSKEYKDLKANVIDTISAPVAGPMHWRILYLICVTIAAVYFLVLVGTASVETWSEPITEIKQEFQMSIDYPDIYMCLPSAYVETYSNEDSTNSYHVWAGMSTTSYNELQSDACDLNEHRGSFIKMDPLSMKPFGSDTSRESYVAADDPGSCPVKKPKTNEISASAPEDTASHMKIGCPYGDDDDCDDFPMDSDDDATKLVSLMPSAAVDSDPGSNDPDDDDAGGDEPSCSERGENDCEVDEFCTWHPDPACLDRECDDEDNEDACNGADGCAWDGTQCGGERRRMQASAAGAYEPLCLKYEMKPGSKQYYDERRAYFLAMQQEVDEVDKSGPYWIMYLAEAGTAPYHCNNMEKDGNERCTINATAIFFPGMPSISIAMLSIEYIKDLREDPDAPFVPMYKYNMWNKIHIDQELGNIQLTRGIMGFQYETFVTRFITIRNKRASEILAELGGLWAAATAFIAIIWSNSGHLNKKGGSEMMIFKYLPGSKRKAYLSGYSIIPKDETAKDIEGQQH